jgi:hypothetical protein
MTTFKTLSILAALLAGGTSLALAQNGLPTGGEPPVAGGAAGNPAVPGPGYSGYYLEAPGYFGAPGYAGQPGYVEESGTSAPGARIVHHRSTYMYVPPHRRTHAHTIAPNGGY